MASTNLEGYCRVDARILYRLDSSALLGMDSKAEFPAEASNLRLLHQAHSGSRMKDHLLNGYTHAH